VVLELDGHPPHYPVAQRVAAPLEDDLPRLLSGRRILVPGFPLLVRWYQPVRHASAHPVVPSISGRL